MRNKRSIVPVEDVNIQKEAKELLYKLLADSHLMLPSRFRKKDAKVALYNPKGILTKANALIIEGEDGAYDLDNRLNDLNGKSWTKFTCSWFIFNALASDLKEERNFTKSTEEHPATFSPTMIQTFIEFFTKEGMSVLDPFVGIGSTLVAAKRANRIGYGIELNKKYYKIAANRVPSFNKNVFHDSSENILKLELPIQDFSISSPPYWDVLNRSTKDFHSNREVKGLDKKYSNKIDDLGNVESYTEFVSRLCKIYEDIHLILRDGAYVVIILKNIKKDGKLYPLAWDVALKLSSLYELKDEKIWIQDKIGLAPYGYPYSWVSNILHHYCLILQKK